MQSLGSLKPIHFARHLSLMFVGRNITGSYIVYSSPGVLGYRVGRPKHLLPLRLGLDISESLVLYQQRELWPILCSRDCGGQTQTV